MPCRVPVLGQDHVGKNRDQAIDDGNDFVATGYGQRPTGAEIILNIDDDQGILLCRV
jgi:hypothetical protein